MGFFDWLFRRKKAELDEPRLPTGPAHTFSAELETRQPTDAEIARIVPSGSASQQAAVQMELMRTQLENMRMQYEYINAKLQNIERIVMEIRRFWK